MKRLSFKKPHCVKEPVAVKPAAIGHRDHRFAFRDKLAVEENPHAPIKAWVCASGKPIAYHLARDPGKAHVQALMAVGQALVVQTEAMEHGGV